MKKTMGEIISTLRKEKGMTQKDLAEQMGVTDKAVSKWERNLSCPDISSIPQLAQILGVSVDALMDVTPKDQPEDHPVAEVVDTVLKVLPLAMGVAVIALSAMGKLGQQEGFTLLGIGMFCMAIRQMKA